MNSNRGLTLESLWCVGVPACRDYPTTLPQNEWFTNHSKSFICFSFVICAFKYRIVELVFVLSYIWSCVWGSIEYSGTRCGDYHSIPRRLTALIRRKILDSAIDAVSEALSVHVAAPTIWIVMVPVGVTVLLGLRNPPRSWTGMVGPSLSGFTIAFVWIPYCDIGWSDGLSLSFKIVPKSKVRVCIYIIAFELSYSCLS
jgi:hypothetical protein